MAGIIICSLMILEYLLWLTRVGERLETSEGQAEKAGTPTMGGIIILSSVFVSPLFETRYIYVLLHDCNTLWMGLIGFYDYIKVFKRIKKVSGSSKYWVRSLFDWLHPLFSSRCRL